MPIERLYSKVPVTLSSCLKNRLSFLAIIYHLKTKYSEILFFKDDEEIFDEAQILHLRFLNFNAIVEKSKVLEANR